MNRFTAIGMWLALLLVAQLARAQDAAAPQPPPAAAQPGEEGKPKPIERLSPAVEAVLSSKPSTPEERVRAVKILTDLGRPDLARPFLEQVLAEELSPEQLAALLERFGSAMFLELSTQPKLQPEAQKLAQAIAAAAAGQAQDTQRLDELIGQLADPSPEVRQRATAALVAARELGVQRLLTLLADESRAGESAQVQKVFLELGPVAAPALIAALESDNAVLTRQSILLLSRMKAQEAVVYLLSPLHLGSDTVREAARTALLTLGSSLPDPSEAAELVAQRAQQYFQRRIAPRAVEGQSQVWQWDADQKQVVFRDLRSDDAARVIARRLARAAHALAPTDKRFARLSAATILEVAAYEAGLDQPIAEDAAAEAEKLGLAAVEEALQESLTDGHPAVTAAAATLLGQKGSAEQHVYRPEVAAPLVLATRCTDRRARVAALEAILRLKPALPYPGSSYVVEALDFLAASRGSRRVLAAAPHTQTALELAGPLAEMGYTIDTATTGREVLRAVLECPDYELLIVDMWLDRPTADVLVQHLRRDNRSADLPVLLATHEGQYRRAEATARLNPLTLAFPRPTNADSLKWQLAQIMELTGREFVPFELRQQQAAQALQWLAELAHGPAFYPLARTQTAALTALHVPELGAQAVPVIGSIGRPESQRALVELASRPSAPLDLREAAIEALQQSIQKHGILLTSGEILRQYDRYNQSAHEDEATQKILSRVLDSLEAPADARLKRAVRPTNNIKTAAPE